MPPYFSVRDVAVILSVEPWRIRRLFEIGAVHEPQRIAGRRAIHSAMIPAIVDGLRARQWLPATEELASC